MMLTSVNSSNNSHRTYPDGDVGIGFAPLRRAMTIAMIKWEVFSGWCQASTTMGEIPKYQVNYLLFVASTEKVSRRVPG